MSSITTSSVKLSRTLTDEQKQKMKDGKARVAAEKLAAEVEAMNKLKKSLDKKMSKLVKSQKHR